MGSSFHYTIDLNEDQNHQAFFSPPRSSLHHNHHQYHNDDDHLAPSNLSSPSSSLTPPSLSHLPFLINSHQDQIQVGYNNNTFQGFLDPHLSQSLEMKKFVSNGGSPSSDQVVPKKETRIKLTIRKKENHHDHEHVRLMKMKTMITTADHNDKQHVNNDQAMNQRNFERDHHDQLVSTNQYNNIVNETGYNGSNSCVVRTCSDCNTTKTPLWRSGPRGPKSLCNACGIRQRKARQAAMAAAAATTNSEYLLSPPLLKKKMQSKNKRSNEVNNLSSPLAPKVKKCKSMSTSVMENATSKDMENKGKSSMSNNFYYDDLAMVLSKSSAYQKVFPQDEKEAAILLMALSYGMVHG
ncbi:unnamed protein product [Eruca vesicaria subsp. sativa]|uniref:GATA-type domain-containing protein n=1 Tax=Eruca vesicaria subsp. sativa TaxID=29727 RepID=A0ABC8JDW5_ERUVS|nr:unnamed protein product [Eruca vesicaria subsp. sativa]